MGRVSFGGGADYSGLFQSLYQSVQSDAAAGGPTGDSLASQAANLRYQLESKQLTAQQYADALRALAATGDQTTTNHFNLLTTAENALQQAQSEADQQAKQAQAAADQSAADAWQNGLMSDGAWLAYLQNRASTAADPTEKAKWQGYLEQYSNSIGDNQAEAAFKAGGSINDLVLYYQGKLGHLTPSSQPYRDAQQRISDLQDQRSATAIQDGSAALSEKINRGAASYKDLLSFYQAQLKSLRPGSDLAKQLQGEIAKVEDTIHTNDQAGKLEKAQYDYERGAITGHAFAQVTRSIAAEFKTSDPQKYYQLLESATKLDKNPGFIGAAAAAAKAKAAKNKALAATVDQYQAQRDNLLSLVKQADAGQKTGFDSVTGKTVALTPSYVKQLDQKILDTYEALAGAYKAKGDHSAEQATWAARNQYIVVGGKGVEGIIGHNTDQAAARYNDLVLGSVKILQANAESSSPKASVVASVAADWAKYVSSLEINPGKYSPEGFILQASSPKSQLQQIDPGFTAKAKAIASALAVAANPNATPDQQQAARDALGVALGADPSFPDSNGSKAFKLIANNLIAPAAQGTAIVKGLADGTVTRLVVDGKLTYTNTRQVAPQEGELSGLPLVPDYQLKDGQKFTQVVVDIDGKPTVVSAVATEASSVLKSWVAAKAFKNLGIMAGQALTDKNMADLDKNYPGWNQNKAMARQVPVYNYYSVQTPGWVDSSGKTHASETWVQDEATGQWYKDKYPLRGAQFNADGTVKVVVGPDGKATPIFDYQSFADAKGVPAPYAGEQPQNVGSLIGVPGGIDVTGLKGRDVNGFIQDTPSANTAFSYFNPTTKHYAVDNWWNDARDTSRVAEARAQALATMPTGSQETDALRREHLPQTPILETAVGLAGQVASSLMDFAKSIGLNLGGAQAAPRPAIQAAPAGTPTGSQETQSLRLEHLGVAPAPVVMPTISAPAAHSGPALNLPPLVLPTIKAPAVIGPSTSASQVTAAATAAAKAAASVTPKVVIPKGAPTHGALEY